MYPVISDLHIFDGGETDEFTGEHDLRSYLKTIPDGSLILNGDAIELCKGKTLQEIIQARASLLDLLFRKTKVYLIGNHDRPMANSSFSVPQFMGVPVMKQVVLDGVLFMHGDLFDLACNEENALIGETLTGITAWLAKNISPEINTVARNLESLVRSVGRNGSPSTYRNKGLSFIEHFWIGGQRLRGICLGHTHERDHQVMNDRITYWNSGCWIGGKTDMVEVA
jgi:UDP-2,3-diacylglucosamine pyrophosphatase LpxH